MNKKLIALAVAGACVVPEAMAQTANPVTLYGRAYATFESVEAKGSVGTIGPVVRRNRVVDQSSAVNARCASLSRLICNITATARPAC